MISLQGVSYFNLKTSAKKISHDFQDRIKISRFLVPRKNAFLLSCFLLHVLFSLIRPSWLVRLNCEGKKSKNRNEVIQSWLELLNYFLNTQKFIFPNWLHFQMNKVEVKSFEITLTWKLQIAFTLLWFEVEDILEIGDSTMRGLNSGNHQPLQPQDDNLADVCKYNYYIFSNIKI